MILDAGSLVVAVVVKEVVATVQLVSITAGGARKRYDDSIKSSGIQQT